MSQAWNHPPPPREAVEAWLDGARPALVADGGNVELIDVDSEGVVHVVRQGACATCPAQLATLRVALEAPLKKALKGVQAVVALRSSSAPEPPS